MKIQASIKAERGPLFQAVYIYIYIYKVYMACAGGGSSQISANQRPWRHMAGGNLYIFRTHLVIYHMDQHTAHNFEF